MPNEFWITNINNFMHDNQMFSVDEIIQRYSNTSEDHTAEAE